MSVIHRYRLDEKTSLVIGKHGIYVVKDIPMFRFTKFIASTLFSGVFALLSLSWNTVTMRIMDNLNAIKYYHLPPWAIISAISLEIILLVATIVFISLSLLNFDVVEEAVHNKFKLVDRENVKDVVVENLRLVNGNVVGDVIMKTKTDKVLTIPNVNSPDVLASIILNDKVPERDRTNSGVYSLTLFVAAISVIMLGLTVGLTREDLASPSALAIAIALIAVMLGMALEFFIMTSRVPRKAVIN